MLFMCSFWAIQSCFLLQRQFLQLFSAMDLNDLNKVWEIKPLKKIGEEDARKVLEKIAKQVQPIMRKRRWKVETLSEF